METHNRIAEEKSSKEERKIKMSNQAIFSYRLGEER
jgi:hypothetical protein